jgi:methionyl-tRNA formyltransferase
MIINILVDNKDSWMIPYAQELVNDLQKDHQVNFVYDQADLISGDFAVFLSCGKIIAAENLKKNKHNLVVHESYLPQGKGMSPLTWQILEKKNDIPITLFEAAEKVDSGDVYAQEVMHFDGHELVDELRKEQGKKTISMVKELVSRPLPLIGKKQEGPESFYPRRRPQDSELDINKSIADQFDLLRVADNERYPAFFNHRGHKYLIKIYKSEL